MPRAVAKEVIEGAAEAIAVGAEAEGIAAKAGDVGIVVAVGRGGVAGAKAVDERTGAKAKEKEIARRMTVRADHARSVTEAAVVEVAAKAGRRTVVEARKRIAVEARKRIAVEAKRRTEARRRIEAKVEVKKAVGLRVVGVVAGRLREVTMMRWIRKIFTTQTRRMGQSMTPWKMWLLQSILMRSSFQHKISASLFSIHQLPQWFPIGCRRATHMLSHQKSTTFAEARIGEVLMQSSADAHFNLSTPAKLNIGAILV